MENRLVPPKPEGIYIPMTEFEGISEAHEKATVGMIQAQKEMDQAKDMMEVASAQVELAIIHEAGGNEKNVGSTETARKRAYDMARSKSTQYLAARDHYFSARSDYKYHQLMVRRFDLHLQFIVATAKSS